MSEVLPRIQAFFDEKLRGAESPYDVEKARGMSVAYITHYANEDWEVRGVEVPFTLPILDPDSGQPTDARYSGIVDAVLERRGEVFFADHKTASNLSQSYWSALETDPQITQYVLAGMQAGLPSVAFLWDVIEKPGISPKKLTKADKVCLDNGEYCGLPFTGAWSGEEKETPRMYGVRVLQWYLEDPNKHFIRRIVERQSEILLRGLRNLAHDVQAAQGVLSGYQQGGIEAVQTQEENCRRYNNSLCDYHRLCTGVEFAVHDYGPRKAPAEGGRKTGSQSLSPSRRACLHRCPREYAYRYVEEIEPLQKTYQEATSVGTLVHSAIEMWLKSRIRNPFVMPNEL